MDLEDYVESLPQDQLPPDGKIHPTRKKLPPTDAVKYIPREKSVGGLVNFDEEIRKKRRQEMEAKLAMSETNNDVSDSRLSKRSREKNQAMIVEKKRQIEKEEKEKTASKSRPTTPITNDKKQKKIDGDENDKFKVEMEQRMEKKTIIDKVTFFDKETKRNDIPETSHDEKLGHDRASMQKKMIIAFSIVVIVVLIALIVVIVLATQQKKA